MIELTTGTGGLGQAILRDVPPTLPAQARSEINRYLYAKTPDAAKLFARRLEDLPAPLVGAIVKELDHRLEHGKQDAWQGRLKEFRKVAQREWDGRLF